MIQDLYFHSGKRCPLLSVDEINYHTELRSSNPSMTQRTKTTISDFIPSSLPPLSYSVTNHTVLMSSVCYGNIKITEKAADSEHCENND